MGREALYKATTRAIEVLHFKGTLLSDDYEESAHSELSPAITWAEEVGLVRGIKWAKGMVRRLSEAEHAKENMLHALAVGNATNKSKITGESRAENIVTSNYCLQRCKCNSRSRGGAQYDRNIANDNCCS